MSSLAAQHISYGELLWDLFPSGPVLGGAPSNLALHLGQLGEASTLISRVGTDELGERAIMELQERGVNTAYVQRDLNEPTGRVEIQFEGNEAHYTLQPGAWRAIEAPSTLPKSMCSFSYGTLSQEFGGLESWRRTLANLDNHVIRLCDPNLRGGRLDRELVYEHLSAASAVKLNEEEAQLIRREFGCKDLWKWLKGSLGVEILAETLGPGGCVLRRGDHRTAVPSPPAPPGGDNVGAGDAFCAVLVKGLVDEAPLDSIARAACLYGSFVASKRGATPALPLALRNEVADLLSC